MARTLVPYNGFEQGPIRPPSEASSLLIRVTRNCPWNYCTFCPVYKGERFSLRPVEHVLKDIDRVRHFNNLLQDAPSLATVQRIAAKLNETDRMALRDTLNWIRGGRHSIFLQDGNSLIAKPDGLLAILNYLRESFPMVERITSYARSQTICRVPQLKLAAFRKAGLNRIHVGMESGSDRVLTLVKKGSTKAQHIQAGRMVREAGITLSEYVMPGLGGREFSKEHALETADALNRIDADFIRLRTLTIHDGTPLQEEQRAGRFNQMSDNECASEILLLLQNLTGIHSTVTSDHILNLFQDVEGTLPEEQRKMTDIIENYFTLPRSEQMVYQVGRRTGIFRSTSELCDPAKRAAALETCHYLQVTPQNVDAVLQQVGRRLL